MWLAAAVGCYAVGFVACGQALGKLQMTVAYPVMTAVTMTLIAVQGVVVLGEAITLTKPAGMVLLCVACLLLSKLASCASLFPDRGIRFT
jgi:small multidrug resistance pump